MGDIADWMFDKAMEEELKLQYSIEELWKSYEEGKLQWTSKENKRIFVHDMSERYITNCINFIQRDRECYENNKEYYDALIKIFETELIKRKEK